MQWGDLPQVLKLIAALVFVLSLMGGLALGLKKLGLSGAPIAAGKKKRLKLVEILPLDSRNKLALIQRDGEQHLIILGGNEACVIETGIKAQDNEGHE